MSSESVWFEQVDTALIEYINDIVKLPNKDGIVTPVPVIIRKPDEDFKLEQYPCISLYNLYSRRDEKRYFPDTVVVSKDPINNKLIEERGAIPYNLVYQLDFWSTMQTHMNDMTRQWLSHFPDKSFNLPVKDISGKDRSSFVLQTDALRKSDYLTGNQRLFHSFLTYRIWVELDERTPIVTPLVTEIEGSVSKL